MTLPVIEPSDSDEGGQRLMLGEKFCGFSNLSKRQSHQKGLLKHPLSFSFRRNSWRT